MLEHTYGLRGKKTDYTPWSCQKIAEKATPSFGETYGCPFVFYSKEKLQECLVEKGLNLEQADDIWRAKLESPFLACRKMFQILYANVDLENLKGVGKHPNTYFFKSYNAVQKKPYANL